MKPKTTRAERLTRTALILLTLAAAATIASAFGPPHPDGWHLLAAILIILAWITFAAATRRAGQ